MALFTIGLLLMAACSVPPSIKPSMERMQTAHYPFFNDDLQFEQLEQAIARSLQYLNRVPPDRMYPFGADRFSAAHMIRSLELFRDFIQTQPSQARLQAFIREHYWVYRSTGRTPSAEVLFTGYFEPFLEGRLERTAEYRYPIYARPDDLLIIDLSKFSPRFKGERIIGRYTERSVVPYYDRKQIETEDRLSPSTPSLAWVRDPVELFFLHVQGSGQVVLDNNERLHVHYHTTNGHPYRSIGKLLIDQGKIDVAEMSMQKIRQYLRQHPEEIDAVLQHNPSYIFFKLEPDGPLGHLGVKLTPRRSIALDRRIFPWSALTFVQTQSPVVDEQGTISLWSPYAGFALNQDTGGAITGPGRADFFWGSGTYAEIAAGHMKHTGKLYFLVLKPNDVTTTAQQ
jgi:membrane-bound lytic murein transglycosylase A